MNAVVIILILLLSACAQTVYIKDGATQGQFQQDQFTCEQQVFTMYGGLTQMGPGHAIMARGDIVNCMKAKGYREATPAELNAMGR